MQSSGRHRGAGAAEAAAGGEHHSVTCDKTATFTQHSLCARWGAKGCGYFNLFNPDSDTVRRKAPRDVLISQVRKQKQREASNSPKVTQLILNRAAI